VDLLLIPGDLTKDGALSSHLQFAAYLDSIEQQGIRVFVVPGNHDVNSGRAVSYADTSSTKTTQVGPGRFSEIYAAFAYDEALYRDSFSLSYIAEPEQDLWLIGLDACLYPDDHSTAYAETGGELRRETIRWLESHLLSEEALRKTKLVVMHHGVLEHFHTQARYFEDYLLHRYKRTSRWPITSLPFTCKQVLMINLIFLPTFVKK
jgi:3',5'-cyclic AMP phosphodiesterase CpdA